MVFIRTNWRSQHVATLLTNQSYVSRKYAKARKERKYPYDTFVPLPLCGLA